MLSKMLAVPFWGHTLALVASFGAFQLIRVRLDQLYAASNHPVDYATGQTTFDAQRIKGFYAHMQEAGTLDVYLQTQRFDYLFMLALAVFGDECAQDMPTATKFECNADQHANI